jgi:hypothetical protein
VFLKPRVIKRVDLSGEFVEFLFYGSEEWTTYPLCRESRLRDRVIEDGLDERVGLNGYDGLVACWGVSEDSVLRLEKLYDEKDLDLVLIMEKERYLNDIRECLDVINLELETLEIKQKHFEKRKITAKSSLSVMREVYEQKQQEVKK